jgi:cytochrome b6-f complex iron-sulfur subunit
MTLKEKLAAARGAASAPAAGARPAAAAPAKPAAAPKAAAAGAARVLPPLEKITDPKDLAEAARQAGASKVKAAAAKAEEGKPVKAGHKKAETPVVPPKPKKEAVLAATTASAAAGQSRRAFLGRVSVGAWVIAGWATFTAGMVALTAACGRFMFPNVLAEPPSTIKVGLPSNFEPEEVSERYKTEWGFWIVRSTKYNGADIIYALQSVCTHLGCPPNWLAAEQKFKCPCHGSGFYVSGVNFEGPAPRPLERFKIVLADDGQLMIDKTQKFQEEMGQWTDPDSFVLV